MLDAIPDKRAILRHCTDTIVCGTVLLHFSHRPRRVQHNGKPVSMQQRQPLNARRRRAWKAKNSPVDHAIDIEDQQWRSRAWRPRFSAQLTTMTRGLRGEEMPGIDKLTVPLLLAAGEVLMLELCHSVGHRPRAC